MAGVFPDTGVGGLKGLQFALHLVWRNDDCGERLQDWIFGLHGGSSTTTIHDPVEMPKPVELLRAVVLGNKEASRLSCCARLAG
jgi:hypothetical protein